MKRMYTFETSNNISLTVEELQPAETVILNLHQNNETTVLEFARSEFESLCSLTWRLDFILPLTEPHPPLLEVLC
jgi:hypothetical protein